MPKDPRQEIIVALAGPAVNFTIAAILYLVVTATGRPDAIFSVNDSLLPTLVVANLMLALFNLLPAFPMDGGRVLRAALAMRMDRVRATRLAARIGQGLAVVLGVIGLLRGNPFLILIAAFVWFGADAEAGAAATDDTLARQPAGRAMITDFHTLAPGDPLSHAVELTLSGTQKDFPVLDGERIAGVLTQPALLRGLRDSGASGRVEAVMAPARTADVSASLAELLETVQASDARLVCITRAGRLAGIVDLDNIAEFLRIRQAPRPALRPLTCTRSSPPPRWARPTAAPSPPAPPA